MVRIRFYPHNLGSQGCSRLKAELIQRGHNVLKVRGNGRYRPRPSDLVINWGNAEQPQWVERDRQRQNFLNPVASMAAAHNKLETFRVLQEAGISIPGFTTDRIIATEWLVHDRETVLARTILNASEGRGITVVEPGADNGRLPNAPLYVKYIKKMNEYRVHVFNGQVIDITEKKRRREFDGERDTHIRNSANGYVFAREDVNPDASVGPLAVRAVVVLGLDFGGVDVIWNQRRRRAYVLEVNTAPGIEGTTVERYADAIENTVAARQRDRQVPPPRGLRHAAAPVELRQPRIMVPAPRPRFNNNRDDDNTDF